jgi:hypothetical protein
MEPSFQHAIGRQKYFAALISTVARLFYRRRQLSCARDAGVYPIAEHPTSLDRQGIFVDTDPPTPNWGC